MTASFSIGFKEQVEYTRRPPIAKSSAPLRKILVCILKQIEDYAGKMSVDNFIL